MVDLVGHRVVCAAGVFVVSGRGDGGDAVSIRNSAQHRFDVVMRSETGYTASVVGVGELVVGC